MVFVKFDVDKKISRSKILCNSTLKNKNKSIKSFGMFGNHYHCNYFFHLVSADID